MTSGAGAKVNDGLFFHRQCLRKRFDWTAVAKHNFARLIYGVRGAKECAGPGFAGIADNDDAPGFFEREV